MKRANPFQIVIELFVILGYIVLGVTILTFLVQRVAIDRIFLGLICILVGTFGLLEYFVSRFAIRIRSIANLIISVLAVIAGILFLIFKMNFSLLCVLFAVFALAIAAARITTSVINLLRQPLLNGIRIILNITSIVLAIFLIIKTVDYLNNYLVFLSIDFLILGVTLLIEFIIHHYQN